MSHRGEFTWEPDDDDYARRMRIIGAVALLCAGWAVGFFSGRMSAWLFPVTNTQIVVTQKAPEPAAPPRTAEKPPAAPAAPTPSATAETKSAEAVRESPAASPPARTDADATGRSLVESEAAPKAGQPEDTTQSKVTVINPDAAKAKPAVQEAARSRDDAETAPRAPANQPSGLDRPSYGYQSASQAAIMECERRYNSFRRSDGTYQPYDRSTRELCPMLR